MNRPVIVEAIGTFFLALVAALSGNPLAVGATLMVMIYAGGHISGGHFNPAVTIGVLLRGKITTPAAILYFVAQFAAAVAAVIIGLLWVTKAGFKEADFVGKVFIQMLVGEILGTFALVYVILNVATMKATEGDRFGLAIGFTVTAMAFAFSGAAFNPAVALTLALVGGAPWYIIFTCLIGAPIGAFAAALVVNLLQGEKTQIPTLPQSPTPPPPPPAPLA